MDDLVTALTIFALALYCGVQVITKVPPTLHTPLMSGSNAISGITVVGALIATGMAVELGSRGHSIAAQILGTTAIALAMINVVGGFLVTDRMLRMFRRKD